MAIKIDTGLIDFGNPSGIDGISQLSIVTWLEFTGAPSGYVFSKMDYTSAPDPAPLPHGWYILGNTDETINFLYGWWNATGWWRSSTGTIQANNLYQVGISYDNSSTANDATIYINGSSVAVTEEQGPGADLRDDTGVNFLVGGWHNNGTPTQGSCNCIIYDIKIYSGIRTAAEFKRDYDRRCHLPIIESDLEIWIPFLGASGCQVFDGVALGSSNLIREYITKVLGQPYDTGSGGPIGAGSKLRIGGQ